VLVIVQTRKSLCSGVFKRPPTALGSLPKNVEKLLLKHYKIHIQKPRFGVREPRHLKFRRSARIESLLLSEIVNMPLIADILLCILLQ